MPPKRFTFVPDSDELAAMMEDGEGEYVTYSDYDLLRVSHRKLCDALASAIERLKGREWDVDIRSVLQIAREDFHA